VGPSGRRAGVKRSWSWQYLGQKGGKHYYISDLTKAALVAPYPIEGSKEYADAYADLLFKVVEDLINFYRAVPAVAVKLPRDFLNSPDGVLLHVHNGTVWVALEDWPTPKDVWRAGACTCKVEAVCRLEYVIDALKREATPMFYVKVAPHGGEVRAFHFQAKRCTVIVAAEPSFR